MSYVIALDGRTDPVDARIDLVGASIILHSRGGSTGGRPPRNTGYAEGLLAICRRAQTIPGSLERVLIDSSVAKRLPESDRVLITREEIAGLSGDELAERVRVRLRLFGQADGTIGGNSTKRVRFDFNLPSGNIVSSLGLRQAEPRRDENAGPVDVARLTSAQLRQVTPLHVRQAVDRLLAGEDAPNFSPSRDYDVVVPGGGCLAPKKVFGLALEQALGIEAFPGHFTAGWGQPCFEIIQQAGFAIVEKRASVAPTVDHQSPLPPEQEEQSWAEGSSRLAQHLRTERRRSRAASAAKRAKVREENQGRLVCENEACGTDWYAVFPLPIAEAVFEIHHSVLVSTMQDEHQTVVDELRCLCAACHRAEHRRLSLLEPDSSQA